MTMPKLDNIFISHACDILAETNSGLSGSKIIEYCNSYACLLYTSPSPRD